MVNLKKVNIWYISTFLISIIVAIPILTVFSSFFETKSNYSIVHGGKRVLFLNFFLGKQKFKSINTKSGEIIATMG